MIKRTGMMCLALSVAAISAAQAGKIVIDNQSSWHIYEFYLSSVYDDDWGPDQLGGDILEVDGRFTLRSVPCDDYDVLLVDEDGDECIVSDVDICARRDYWVIDDKMLLSCEAATAETSGSTFEVLNLSDWDIHRLFVSSAEDRQWGTDQLGQEILYADGGSFTLQDIPCDDYDVMVVDEDGDECVLEQVGMCGDDNIWKITNRALLSCQGY